MRRLVPVKGHARDQAHEPHCHGRCRDTKTDVHPGASLDPDEDGKCDELADTEAEVRAVEVSGELLKLVRVVFPELVCSMRDHVGLEAATAQGNQVEGNEEDGGLEAFGLSAEIFRHHVALRWPQLWEMCLH